MKERLTHFEMVKILIADDEPAILRVLRIAFTRAGFEVTTASDGREAAMILSRASFDVLLSDIRMPEMDGYELTRFANEHCSSIVTILMTGYDDSLKRCESSLPNRFILKPFLPKDVLAVVDRALWAR